MIDKDLRKGDREKDLLDKLNSFTKNFRQSYDDGPEPGTVEISQSAIDRISSQDEPRFKNKIEESIYRLKNKK